MPIPADWHSIRSDALNIPPATKPEDFGFGGVFVSANRTYCAVTEADKTERGVFGWNITRIIGTKGVSDWGKGR